MSKLRIGIDLAATAGQKSGLGWYVERLIGALEQLPHQYEFVKFRTIKKNLRTPQRIVWDQFGLPMMALSKRVDGLFVPAFSAPHFPKPVVMTAHDIYGVLYPEQFSTTARWYWSHLLPNSFRRTQHLLCVSEHTKKDLITHLGISEKKLSVVPLAAGDQFHVVDDTEWIQQRLRELHITPPFILSVGTREPRKNYERLLEAFAFASRGDVKLVIVGKEGWKTEGITHLIQRFHLASAVQFIDYCSEEQLVALYNACQFFIMPSLYEGFGLPALEAMSCGAPVAVSQNSSLPEVVGEAGLLFNPYDIAEIRDRMNLLFSDTSRRTSMQRVSLERSRNFSWKTTAQKTLDVFKNVFV